jgi:hypothetical protein
MFFFYYQINIFTILLNFMDYLATYLSLYGETKLFFSKIRFCFLRNFINELKNKLSYTMDIFQNIIFLKPSNFFMGG